MRRRTGLPMMSAEITGVVWLRADMVLPCPVAAAKTPLRGCSLEPLGALRGLPRLILDCRRGTVRGGRQQRRSDGRTQSLCVDPAGDAAGRPGKHPRFTHGVGEQGVAFVGGEQV